MLRSGGIPSNEKQVSKFQIFKVSKIRTLYCMSFANLDPQIRKIRFRVFWPRLIIYSRFSKNGSSGCFGPRLFLFSKNRCQTSEYFPNYYSLLTILYFLVFVWNILVSPNKISLVSGVMVTSARSENPEVTNPR